MKKILVVLAVLAVTAFASDPRLTVLGGDTRLLINDYLEMWAYPGTIGDYEFVTGTSPTDNVNDGWFGISKAPYQHMSMSVFRAVENHIPVIFNANTGVSCFIDRYGRISNRISKDDDDIFIAGTSFANIYFNGEKTFYTKYGNIFIIFNIIWLVILTGIYIFVRIAPHPSLLPT